MGETVSLSYALDQRTRHSFLLTVDKASNVSAGQTGAASARLLAGVTGKAVEMLTSAQLSWLRLVSGGQQCGQALLQVCVCRCEERDCCA